MANADIPSPERPKSISGGRRRFIKKIGKKALLKVSEIQTKKSLVPTTPFIDNKYFDFLPQFEEHWQEIEKEAREILKFRDEIPGFEDISPDQYRIAKDNKWKTFVLYGFGTRLEKNTALTPVSARLLETIPNLQTAWFSILAPGYHIPAHKGVTKGIVRSHLGLIIPKDYEKCRIRVDDQIMPWQAGKVFTFDDTYEHEVWNDTDEERVILLFDFDRPMKFSGRFLNKLMMKLMKMTAYYQDPKKNLASAEDRFEAAVKQAGANLEAMSD
ncbi:MAG: aspartyl beta-hydroxylase [Robiginitomaculum sp.]|nr:MAG: aspartyl beta-hydroxylase [Robiginitomaculum sp.]